MSTTTEVDLTIKDIADRLSMNPRTINLWRVAAEERLGCKLGYKSGKTWYFPPDHVREILKSRESVQSGNSENSQKFRETPNFSQVNNQAESNIIGGMDGIVAAGDQNALAVGQALAARHTQIMWTAYLQNMQSGFMQMQNQFEELHASIDVSFSEIGLPSLSGISHTPPQLEGETSGR